MLQKAVYYTHHPLFHYFHCKMQGRGVNYAPTLGNEVAPPGLLLLPATPRTVALLVFKDGLHCLEFHINAIILRVWVFVICWALAFFMQPDSLEIHPYCWCINSVLLFIAELYFLMGMDLSLLVKTAMGDIRVPSLG